MCSITGFVSYKESFVDTRKLLKIFKIAVNRGRDSFGVGHYIGGQKKVYKTTRKYEPLSSDVFEGSTLLIANHRAEPTTEYVKEKRISDVHPFEAKELMLVHNGTIANDKELAKEFGREDLIGKIDTRVLTELIADQCKTEEEAAGFIIKRAKGSYAIALTMGNCVALVTNYKPLYLNFQPEGIYFSSLAKYIKFSGEVMSPSDNIQKLPPYSYALVGNDGIFSWHSFRSTPSNRALVICSGGLDSTVALTTAVRKFGKENVALLHYKYHCNAEVKEVESARKIAEHFGIELILMPIDIFGSMITESPILKKEGQIQEYDKGVEFAYEWVPARNLVMMSLAIALAEAKGYGYIYLGNNLEEAGAYPDNEMEFMNKIQEIMPNAVRDGYALDVVQPVGNLMKHEIVKLGLEIGAPLHLTWSCYKANDKHCGVCGPCRMRRVAFQMAGKDEVVEYENQ